MSAPSNRGAATATALSDLRGPRPVDAAVENLLVALTAKLEMHSRLRVWAHEAARNGCAECVRTFKSVADSDRAQIDELLTALRHHFGTAKHATSADSGGLPRPVMP